MAFGPGKTPVFDSPPEFAAFKGLFRSPCLPSNLTPILMVGDILDSIGHVLQVLTLRVMIEGRVDTIPSGYIRYWISHGQNDLLTYQVCIPGNLTEDLCRALPYPVELGM